MNNDNFQILAFEDKYNDALMDLEHLTPQGKKVKLEMLRPLFLSRSEIFERYSVDVAIVQPKGDLIGVAGVSIVPIKHKGSIIHAGFGYDLKVHPLYRQKGLAKKFGKKLVEEYLIKNGITDYFITLKTGNIGAAKAVFIIPQQWFTYDFLYLTIPTSKRIKSFTPGNHKQLLSTELLSRKKGSEAFIIDTESGLSIWKTYKSYQLKIQDMPWYMDLGAKIVNLLTSKKKKIPKKGDVLEFATLFNYTPQNLESVNEVLQILQYKNIPYLNVCCTKGDIVYEQLNPLAMNVLPYTMLNTFGAENGQPLTLDVRCL